MPAALYEAVDSKGTLACSEHSLCPLSLWPTAEGAALKGTACMPLGLSLAMGGLAEQASFWHWVATKE